MSKPLKAFGMASAASAGLAASVFSLALIGAGIALSQPSSSSASDVDYNSMGAYEQVVMSEADLEAKYGPLNTEALHESKEFIIRRLACRLRARRQAIKNFRRSYPCSRCQPSARVPSPSAQPSLQPHPLLVVSGGSSTGGEEEKIPEKNPSSEIPSVKPLEIVPDAMIESTK